MSSGSDRVPPALKKVLTWDVALTKKTVDSAFKVYPQLSSQTYRSYMKVLEFSCHGIPWFAVTLISIYLFRSTSSRELEINLLLGLIYDVLLVAVIKAVTRRQRPSTNSDDMFFAHGPDKFSFPSGHASRAVFLACFFTHFTAIFSFIPIAVALYTWAAAVCVSRVLLRRHHVLDVACGVGLGLIEYVAVGAVLWLGPESAKWLGDSIAGAEDEFDGS